MLAAVSLRKKRETPGTILYEWDGTGQRIVDTIYLRKDAAGDAPENITLVINASRGPTSPN